MSVNSPLGEFEMLILAAVERLGDDAYSVTVRREIEERTGRLCSFGAVYTTLERLGTKGFVSFAEAPRSGDGAGRPRKMVKATAAGRRALRDVVRSLDAMIDGLRLRPDAGRR